MRIQTESRAWAADTPSARCRRWLPTPRMTVKQRLGRTAQCFLVTPGGRDYALARVAGSQRFLFLFLSLHLASVYRDGSST
jgi:hypothetical protein